ncbi:MAG: thiamine pyrophosphate-binding protein [Dehalococcoidia bacterium]|nr:thiamine pyrophosphate-binding protein [Dehalococcoidia bacterium]
MDRGRAICQELKRAGIHHLVWLPDSETHFMHEAMLTDPEIDVIQVCREGEAVAVCAGLHLGGKRGALLVENQGIFETGNVLKWAISLDIPMLLLVGYLFYRFQKDSTPKGGHTESFLSAFGINYSMIDADDDVKRISSACEEAWNTRRPVALLLTSADEFVPGT